MIKSPKGYLTLLIVITSCALTLLTTGSSATIKIYGQAGTGVQNIKATYAIEIVPGAAQKSNLIHYYPPAIAVPSVLL